MPNVTFKKPPYFREWVEEHGLSDGLTIEHVPNSQIVIHIMGTDAKLAAEIRGTDNWNKMSIYNPSAYHQLIKLAQDYELAFPKASKVDVLCTFEESAIPE